jgi:hypothetical protein
MRFPGFLTQRFAAACSRTLLGVDASLETLVSRILELSGAVELPGD